MRSEEEQKGQRRQKEGKIHYFHLFGPSASHGAFHIERILKKDCATYIDNDLGVRRVSP
jgi:hypothetical protein